MLKIEEAREQIVADPKNAEVLHPYLIANELIGRKDSLPRRYVIDFHNRSLLEARQYKHLFLRIQSTVLPDREIAAREEQLRNIEALGYNQNAPINHHHRNFLNKWWILSWSREDMLADIRGLYRYIVCGRVTLRPIFEFVHSRIRPNDSLIVFPYEDDYSFGILQSVIHWVWFTNRCSTLTGRYRYTSNTVFDSFPWPQNPTRESVVQVVKASVALRKLRYNLKSKHDISFRALYRTLEFPGASPLKDAHAKLDNAVRQAYGVGESDNILSFLLDLNQSVANREDAGDTVVGPGLPPIAKEKSEFVTDDCIKMLA